MVTDSLWCWFDHLRQSHITDHSNFTKPFKLQFRKKLTRSSNFVEIKPFLITSFSVANGIASKNRSMLLKVLGSRKKELDIHKLFHAKSSPQNLVSSISSQNEDGTSLELKLKLAITSQWLLTYLISLLLLICFYAIPVRTLEILEIPKASIFCECPAFRSTWHLLLTSC